MSTTGNKIILLELNEVPYRILHYYMRIRPRSTLASIWPHTHQYETVTADVSHLSPWKTWPTLHRGVNDQRHGLLDFGQDTAHVDAEYPPLWTLLARAGVDVGVFGSLHTWPPPRELDHVSFWVPDAFAAGSECFPDTLESFQSINLQMSRASSRNVSNDLPWSQALRLLRNLPDLGLRVSTLADTGRQLVHERVNPARIGRRRIYQSVLCFDLFMKQLADTQPGFATFFTNHVASSMHRYWAALFPEDYHELGGYDFESTWRETYEREILFAMDKADAFMRRLVDFADENRGYEVWVSSSMGQAAIPARPVHTELHVTRPMDFLTWVGLDAAGFEVLASMLPQYNFRIKDPGDNPRILKAIERVSIDGRPVGVEIRDEGTFLTLTLGHKNIDPAMIQLDGAPIQWGDAPLHNLKIDDMSGASAYHIPEGILVIYRPDRPGSGIRGRQTVSALEVAPSILANFGVDVPGHMERPSAL